MPKLFTVVSDQAFSILPMIFLQLSFLKTLLSRTEAASRTLLPWEGPEDCYCDQILTIEVEKNAGAEATFFFFRLGCCRGASYILGSAGFLIRMVSNK